MSRRRGRSAAVVLAGCVGLAVMAPGVALAAAPPSSTTDCVAQLGAGDVGEGTGCAPSSAATGAMTGAGAGGSTSRSESTSESTTTTTTAPPSSSGTGDTGGVLTSSSRSGGPANSPAAVTNQQATNGSTGTTGTTGTTGRSATSTPVVTPGAATAGGQQLVSQLAAATLPGGITLPDDFTPGAGSLSGLLGNLPVPTTVPEGGFTNPQQACAFLVGGLPIEGTPDQLASLGTAFSQFCTSLPTSFTGLDLSDLLGFLTDLLGHLPAPGTGSGVIPAQPPQTVPAPYRGYWTHHYDVDCPELTFEEANAILAADPSDPFRLDGDHDGVACEENAHGTGVAYADYPAYPVGGVATGDGSTDTGASGVEVALAAGALSGLGLTGLVLVRRFARQG